MRRKEHTPWSKVGEIAGEQWSQIRLAQLIECGLSEDQARRAVRSGRLFPSFTRVFSVGHPIAHPRERAMAATLAYWPEGQLDSHWALWNFGLIRLPAHDPDVLAGPSRHARPGITLHRTKHLPEPDHNHGIPSVPPNRAIITAAPTLPDKTLRRVVNQAQITNLTTAESLREDAKSTRGIPTTKLLSHLPEDQHGATRSLLEDLLFDLHRERNLQRPLINHEIHGVEVDFAYPSLHLIIEVDGWETHRTRQAFEDDRAKRLHLEACGERVLWVSYRQATTERDRTMDHLERIIRAHSHMPYTPTR